MIKARIGDTTVGLIVVVTKNGVPQTGETVLVRIAEADTSDSYLDFNDDTFKTSGWTTKTVTMTEDASETGTYKYVWDSSSAVSAEARLSVEYEITSGSNRSKDSEILIIHDEALEATSQLIKTAVDEINLETDASAIANAVWDEVLASHTIAGSSGKILSDAAIETTTQLIKKMLINRLELSDGGTNNWVLYDDDDSTPLLTFSVKDKLGNDITQPFAAPSRRTRGT